MPPASQGNVPFGPEGSWPAGYSDAAGFPDAQYRTSGGYGYEASHSASPSAPSQGAHPYAGFDSGYGDNGYSDPGYQGPAAQDAGYAPPEYLQAPTGGTGYDTYGQPGHGQPGYAGPGAAEAGYPPAGGSQHGADLYSQPWDYAQPLRYEGEAGGYPGSGGYPAADGYGQRDRSGRPADDGSVRYQPPTYDPGSYNGSDYSMPGIDGPGYDLSGIIGTSDFEAFGDDEPSYGRLSYDDPRYDSRPAGGATGGFDETRFDVPRYDETRLDNLWPNGGDAFHHAPAPGRTPRDTRTRYDLQVLSEPADSTRFDVPAFDETRLDNLRALTPGGGMRRAGTAVLAPPAGPPRNWADDTSLDYFDGLDLADEPVPAAFTRTLDRPQRDSDTAARRAAGKRRGRSGDRRQWMALGAIAVVAAGAIGGVLMKYVFSGPSGPTHEVVAPQSVDKFTRSANLEKQLGVSSEAAKVASASGGQASSVVSAVYEQGSLTGTGGGSTQIFMFVGGKLAGADPGASVANFEQTYAGAKAVSPGALGGEAACTETHLNGQSASMCVWFDNDTFGTVVSPTMTTAKLAATMDQARPSLELSARK
jgi:hypothetical protein